MYSGQNRASIPYRLGFLAHGITNGEHMAMTFAIERNDETGAVTVHFSEPEGFPSRRLVVWAGCGQRR